MAVVRFSDALKSDIIYRANHMFDERIMKARELDLSKWGNENDFALFVYNNLFSDEMRGHMHALGTQFMEQTNNFSVNTVNGHEARFAVRFASAQPWPVLGSTKEEVHGGKLSRYEVNLQGEMWDDLATEVVRRNNNLQRVTEERDTFVTGVKTIINRHVTLAPALREWKPLWDLLPEEAKNRHKRKVERRTAETVAKELADEGVDLNKLTSIVGLNRLKGGI